MIVEIVSTGTELLLGEIVNTTAPFLARQLNDLGYDTLYQTTVGDNHTRMEQVIATALPRSDIVIVTGGLGPTNGDISKEVTAKILNRKLTLHEPSAKRIIDSFVKRNIQMAENNLRQAMMHEDGIVLDNDYGIAPGVIIEDKKTIVHLPGPPHELEPMFEYKVKPYLFQRFGNQGIILSKILRTYGIGEALLEEKIQELVLTQTNPTIALLARSGEIHIRLTAKDIEKNSTKKLINGLEEQLRQQIGQYIIGVDDGTIEKTVGQLLNTKKLTISLAESCTGGLVSSRLTDIAGSSNYLVGSVICYNNAIKNEFLSVPEQTLSTFGAVSKETALSMAKNIRSKFKTNLGLSITGMAGPSGGSTEKPVGLVYIAIDGSVGCQYYEYNFLGNREAIKIRSAQAALYILLSYIKTL